MKKLFPIFFLFLFSLLLLNQTRASECKPSLSYSTDSSYYIGETGKLTVKVSNGCEISFKARVDVSNVKTFGYIKVYYVTSEAQKPKPIKHDNESYGVSSFEDWIDSGESKNIVFFVQPDELSRPGTYTLILNYYANNNLEQTKEISIRVSNPLQINYQLPTQMTLGTTVDSKITIRNLGKEPISYLSICLSSDIVNFSQSCKTWSDLPSGYSDSFAFTTSSASPELKPEIYRNPIQVKIYYKAYTSLGVSDSYTHPSIKLIPPHIEPPSLAYRISKSENNLTIYVTNNGKSSAYDCLMRISTPKVCMIDSSSLKEFIPSLDKNVFEIECGNEIKPDEYSMTILTFNSSGLNQACYFEGSLSYEDSYGKSYEASVNKYTYFNPLTTSIQENKRSWKKIGIYAGLAVLVIIIIIFLISSQRTRILGSIQKTQGTKNQEQKIHKEL